MAKVLIVEDDYINALVLRKYLAATYPVAVASNGKEAIDLAGKEIFDVILMDINLGDDTLDGTETMIRLRGLPQYRHIPIFAVTAYTGEEFRDHLLAAGFDGFFNKPINQREILDAIQTALAQ